MKRLLLLTLALLLVAPHASASPWQWPLDDHRIDRPFDPPASEYGAGHRGVDLPGRVGQRVRAVAAGHVTFAGRVAGVATITITHGTERSTYQPVSPHVRVGDAVAAGQVIGTLLGGHPSCRQTCLNLGRLRGETYLDPADLLATEGSYRLISPDGPPPEPPVSTIAGDLPIAGPISSAFGMRTHPVTGQRKLHDGVDIAAACGTEVPTVAAGTVTRAGMNGAYGLQVEVRHGESSTSYSHLSSTSAHVGSTITAGTVVGRVGTTGLSTGCHLHFMRMIGGRPVDPLG